MNPSELNSLVGVIITAGAPIVARWGIPADVWGPLVHQLAQDVPAVAGAAYLIYIHWNMKKVPEKANVAIAVDGQVVRVK